MCTVLARKNCHLLGLLEFDVILSQNVVHLGLSPLAPLTCLTVVVVLIVQETDELHSCIVTAASPLVEECKTALGLFLLPCLEALAHTVVVPEVIEYILVLALCISYHLNKVKVGVFLIDNCPHNACA